MALGSVLYSGVGYYADVDLDKPVYKFYPLQRFLEAVDGNRLYFRNITHWDDNWELPTRLFNTEGLDEWSSFFFQKDVWRPTFAACFTSNFDTDAMWRIYSPNKSGICIETTARLLLEEMEKLIEHGVAVYYGPMIYLNMDRSCPAAMFDREKVREYPAQFYSSYLKRDAFSHEREMRLAVQRCQDTGSFGRAPHGIELPALMGRIVKKVILDPRLTPQEVRDHKLCLERLGFPAGQSSLFADVRFKGADYAPSVEAVSHSSAFGEKFASFREEKSKNR